MFVFKAAVVGAGTMGGEIAQVCAAAGVDVVLKDVEQKFVDQGLQKAEQVTKGQLGGLVKKEKITQEQADKQAEEILGRITGTLDYALADRRPLGFLLDFFFIRPRLRESQRRLLRRFAIEAAEEAALPHP